jgi:acetylglutamate kinase
MLYSGLINKNIISKLSCSNKKYIGLSGVDSKVIESKKREIKDIDYGHVGDIKKIDGHFIKLLLKNKSFPVFCPITANNKGELLNTNADTIAKMTKYYNVNLFYFFDKPGVIIANKVIGEINEKKYSSFIKSKEIKDGMIPKLDNSFKARRNGVKKVLIGDINIFEKSHNSTEICLN